MTIDDVRDLLRQECAQAGTQTAWAKTHGLGSAYVSDVINGRRDPGKALLKALGLERIISYRRMTVIEEPLRQRDDPAASTLLSLPARKTPRRSK